MSQDKTHDLYDFMRQLSDEMAAEYDRIQKRASVVLAKRDFVNGLFPYTVRMFAVGFATVLGGAHQIS